MAATSEGSTFKIDWNAIERASRTVREGIGEGIGGGGDGGIDWTATGILGTSEEESKNLIGRAVDGVVGFLQKIHLPRLGRGRAEAPAAVAPEPEEAGRSKFFGWLGERSRRFKKAPAVAAVVSGEPESETDRVGWLKKKINKLRRKSETGTVSQAPRKERVRALKEGTTQFLKDWGPEVAVGLLGVYLGASTVSLEQMMASGSLTPLYLEFGACITAVLGTSGLFIGDERGPEAIPEVEGRFGRVATAIQRGLSNKVVRRGLKLLTFGSGGFAVGGVGRMVVETLQAFQQGTAAAVPAAEVMPVQAPTLEAFSGGDLAARTSADEMAWRTAAEVVQNVGGNAAETVQQIVSKSTDTLAAANNILAGIGPDVTGDPGVQQAVDVAQQAIDAFNRFNASAAGGGFDAGEAARLQQLAADAMHMASQAADAAREAVQQTDILAAANNILAGIGPDVTGDPGVQQAVDVAQQAIDAFNRFNASAAGGGIDAGEAARLQQLAADAMHMASQAADAAQRALDAETVRQGVLQGGQTMKDVIAATPSGTVFEALIQQVQLATGSPHSVEAANAISWILPKGDITGLHSGAIQEGAKAVAGLLQQAHDFAAAHGGEYTVRAIRQAVTDGLLSKDVLRAVEAANLPAGDAKTLAMQAINTILQSVIR